MATANAEVLKALNDLKQNGGGYFQSSFVCSERNQLVPNLE